MDFTASIIRIFIVRHPFLFHWLDPHIRSKNIKHYLAVKAILSVAIPK